MFPIGRIFIKFENTELKSLLNDKPTFEIFIIRVCTAEYYSDEFPVEGENITATNTLRIPEFIQIHS